MVYYPRRIRFDDVLWSTGDPKIQGKEFQKLTKNINWCESLWDRVVLAPAILVKDIQAFPECIEWVRQKTEEGFIYPDLHGYDHGPYQTRTEEEVSEHLDKSLEWFNSELDTVPVRWVTPHGSNSPAMTDAARKHGLVIETTDFPVVDQKAADTLLRESWDLQDLDNKVIMNHWWERGLRLYRLAKVLEYQNVQDAMGASKIELSAKDWKICWNDWNDPNGS